MAGTFSRNKTYVTGETITASDHNAEQDWVITNVDPDGVGDASADNSEMQATADPYASDTASLATDLRGELQRIRYQFAQLKAKNATYWYENMPSLGEMVRYRRPNLLYINGTTVDVENNTGTSNETTIIFPDGEARSVTEDTSSANKYRRFNITATAEYTTGTEDSGLYTGLSEATNTWYAIYAVKSTVDTSKFVLVGTTTLPIQSNFSTLNTNLGTDSWVYLGMIRNGDSSGATGDILSFTQAGSRTMFKNIATGNAINHPGIREATSAAATSITWTFSEGTGTADIPHHCVQVSAYGHSNVTSGEIRLRNSGVTFDYAFLSGPSSGSGMQVQIGFDSTHDLSLTSGSAAMDIFLDGFYDSILAGGPFGNVHQS